jgi:hypothetical protein
MKVKVGHKIHDGAKEPVMVILTEQDKENIRNMSERDTKYCEYPEEKCWTNNDYEMIKKWMNMED